MTYLHVGGLNRYYLCLECGAIREEICNSDGTIAYVRIYEAESEDLPDDVVEQARAILEQPIHEQLSLFGE